MRSILVVVGAGYIGTEFSKLLFRQGYSVRAPDTFWFGDFLESELEIKRIKVDIRDLHRHTHLGEYVMSSLSLQTSLTIRAQN
jgi:UDP-glucose 4-epimerase